MKYVFMLKYSTFLECMTLSGLNNVAYDYKKHFPTTET